MIWLKIIKCCSSSVISNRTFISWFLCCIVIVTMKYERPKQIVRCLPQQRWRYIIMSGTAFSKAKHTATACARCNRITAVTRANCLVYWFYRCEQASTLWCLFPFHFLSWCHYLCHCCFLHSCIWQVCLYFLFAPGLQTFLYGFLQHLQYPHKVIVAVLIIRCSHVSNLVCKFV